ncbi:MAG: molybdate ABC transporter substrate-binding protein [Pseudomonadota bacterium]
MLNMSRRLCAILALALGVALPVSATRASGPMVYAAASLRNALDDALAVWQRQSGKAATVNYGPSNALARQIEAGAPADLFISADLDWMRYLQQRGLTQKDSTHAWLGNRLVLVAPRDSPAQLAIAPGFALGAALGDGRLAICNPAVPAGRYGRAALQALGVWNDVAARVALADNVRAALALVARGEVPLGIVYATDAKAEPAVRTVDVFPGGTHPPILYPIALLRDSSHPGARALLDFLRSEQARASFEKAGFTWLVAAGDAAR